MKMIKLERTAKIAGVVLTSILASAIWDFVGRPLIANLGTLVASQLSSMSASYENSIYIGATEGIARLSILSGTYIVLVLLCLIGMILSRLIILNNAPIPASRRRVSRRYEYILIFLYLYIGIYGIYRSIKLHAAYEIASTSMHALEIIHPYVKEHEYEILRSEFFRSRSKADFERFSNMISGDARKANIAIPLKK